MNRRCWIWPAILAAGLLVSTLASAAGPAYNDPLGRFSVAIQPGWSLNPVHPDDSIVEFLKARDRFRVLTLPRSQQDALSEAHEFLSGEGANAVLQQSDTDSSVRAVYSSDGMNVMISVTCTDKSAFVLQYLSRATIDRSAFDRLTAGFVARAEAPFGPDPSLWETTAPHLHRDPRGRFTFSHPPFWVLTALNTTNGDATYTTRFEEIGGAGDFAIHIYPGVMGDLLKHMAGWTDSLARDAKHPGFEVSGEPQLMQLGGVPIALSGAEYGPEGARRILKLMLATCRGTNYSVVLDYRGEGAETIDSRLWGLLKSLRF